MEIAFILQKMKKDDLNSKNNILLRQLWKMNQLLDEYQVEISSKNELEEEDLAKV